MRNDAKEDLSCGFVFNHGRHGDHGGAWVVDSVFDREFYESSEFFLVS